jgi:hypothetical protein
MRTTANENKTNPRREAEGLLALMSAGQTCAVIRRGIEISLAEERFLRETLKTPQLAEILAYRRSVLEEFDKLTASPETFHARSARRRRELARLRAIEKVRLRQYQRAWERARRAEAQ